MEPDEIESLNLREIESLNQRGGRTLSFVDLIEAGTVSAELAGELAALVESGASILTAARLGGVGKSTVLADLLACLPPGERIRTVADRTEVASAARLEGPTCLLAHEIGAGPYYSYLWGPAAAAFLELQRPGVRIASCIHADALEELYGILDSQGASPRTVQSIGLVVFVRRVDGRRRVDSVYVPGPGGHRVRWLWEEETDVFAPQGPAPVDPARAAQLADVFEELVAGGVRDFASVRRALAGRMAADGRGSRGS